MLNAQTATAGRTNAKRGFLGWGYMLGVSFVAAGAAATARADTVNLTYAGPSYGRVVRVSLGTQSWDSFAGRLVHTASSGNGQMAGPSRNIVTFCVDMLQGHASSPSAYSTAGGVAGLSGNAGQTSLGYGKQQAIYDLYQAAGNRQFTAGQDCAAAFQVALWEVVYDYNANQPHHGLNVTSGNFRAVTPGQSALTPSINGAVQYLLNAVGINAAAHGLVGLRSSQFQDQLYAGTDLVPLPGAAWIGMGGLGLIGVVRARRRRA